jgi:hypothetical protein
MGMLFALDGIGDFDPFGGLFNCFYVLAALLIIVGTLAMGNELRAWLRMRRL